MKLHLYMSSMQKRGKLIVPLCLFLLCPFASLPANILQDCDAADLLSVQSYRNQNLEDYPRLKSRLTRSFTVPGLAAGFVPQGIAFLPNSSHVILSGYLADTKHAVVILVDSTTGIPERVGRLFSGDSPKMRHAGGIAVTGDHFWIPGNTVLLRFPIAGLVESNAPPCIQIDVDRIVDGIGSRGSHLSSWGNHLIVGDFGRSRAQRSHAHHPIPHHRSPENRRLHFRSLVFSMDQETNLPKSTSRPCLILHHDEHVQGIAFAENGLVLLSRSWGDRPSCIDIHHISVDAGIIKSATLSPYTANTDDDYLIPSVTLSGSNLIDTFYGPPGSEGIIITGNTVMTVFEGGAYDYRLRWKTIEDRVLVFVIEHDVDD